MKTYIVEDDNKTADTIEQLLSNYCYGTVVCGRAAGVAQAIIDIENAQPDLLIMDVELNDGKSFEILEKIDFNNLKIIFITAHNEYAIKAIKFSALDFLLKPINPLEFIEAVNKAFKLGKSQNDKLSIGALMSNLIKNEKKIVLKTLEAINIVNVKEIIRCESDSSYTVFYMTDLSKIMVSKPLKEFDELLTEYGFFRVHQSHLINITFIKRFDRADGGMLIMSDNSQIPVATRKKEKLMELFNSL